MSTDHVFTTIMNFYKHTKAMVHLHHGDTNFYDIVSAVLQGDALALFLCIICLDYAMQTSIDLMKWNGFTLKKASSRQYLLKLLLMQTMQMI